MNVTQSPLGNSGFVFLDDRPWPYAVKEESSGEWWLYYWADSTKSFATLRRLLTSEVEYFRALSLPPERAALYLSNAIL